MSVSLDSAAYQEHIRKMFLSLKQRLEHPAKPFATAKAIGKLNLLLDSEDRRLHSDSVNDAIECIKRARGNPKYEDKRLDLFKLLLEFEDINDAKQSVQALESLDREEKQILEASERNNQHVLAIVNGAIQRVKNWQQSPVTLVVDVQDGVASSYTVKVNQATITLFITDSGIELDDIWEGGDDSVFADVKEQSDYFNLIKEIRKPGSSSQGKDIVLWTARPARDRDLYSSSKKIPTNIFLTNDADRASGLADASDLGGGIGRDLWRVVVNDQYLVMTLDRGSIKDYQAIGDGWIPVKSLTLYSEASRLAKSIAARYITR